MDPADWFASLEAAIAAAAGTADTAPAGSPSPQERAALLDLARVAAHTAERWTAPISTYLVGLALAERAEPERVAVIRGLVDELGTLEPEDRP